MLIRLLIISKFVHSKTLVFCSMLIQAFLLLNIFAHHSYLAILQLPPEYLQTEPNMDMRYELFPIFSNCVFNALSDYLRDPYSMFEVMNTINAPLILDSVNETSLGRYLPHEEISHNVQIPFHRAQKYSPSCFVQFVQYPNFKHTLALIRRLYELHNCNPHFLILDIFLESPLSVRSQLVEPLEIISGIVILTTEENSTFIVTYTGLLHVTMAVQSVPSLRRLHRTLHLDLKAVLVRYWHVQVPAPETKKSLAWKRFRMCSTYYNDFFTPHLFCVGYTLSDKYNYSICFRACQYPPIATICTDIPVGRDIIRNLFIRKTIPKHFLISYGMTYKVYKLTIYSKVGDFYLAKYLKPMNPIVWGSLPLVFVGVTKTVYILSKILLPRFVYYVTHLNAIYRFFESLISRILLFYENYFVLINSHNRSQTQIRICFHIYVRSVKWFSEHRSEQETLFQS